MRETCDSLTALTSALGDERPNRGLGVSIRRENGEIEYLDATGLEEHAPMDWMPDQAIQLLREHGYEVIGEWEDIDHTGGDDPTWKTTVVRCGVLGTDFGDDDRPQSSMER